MGLASLLIRLGNEKFQKLLVVGLLFDEELLELFRRVFHESEKVLFNIGPKKFLLYVLVQSLLPAGQEALGYPINFGLPVFIVCRDQKSSVGVNGSAVNL